MHILYKTQMYTTAVYSLNEVCVYPEMLIIIRNICGAAAETQF